MAWTAPVTWTTGQIVMASGTGSLNEQIRDNFLALSGHAHTGAAGDGSATLTGVSFSNTAGYQFADQSADPTVTGTIQRNGANILYYDGSTAVDLTAADQSAGTASLRSLGVTSNVAAAGNHQHSTNVTITNLQSTTYDLSSVGAAFPSSGLPTNQTNYTVPPSGVEFTLDTYSWTPTTADNCYLSVGIGLKSMITYIDGSNLPPLGNLGWADGSQSVNLRLKVDGVTEETISTGTGGANTSTFQLYKTANTTTKTITVTLEFTATTWPYQYCDTDSGGSVTGSPRYWVNSIMYVSSGNDYKQLVFTV